MRLFGRKDAKAQLQAALRGQNPPTFPAAVMKLLKLLRDPEADMRTVAEALRWDPGLVVKVLQLVNSAALGLARRVDDVQHAATLLGRSQLEQLVLGVAVKNVLPRKNARGFESQRFWNAAFFRAVLAQTLAQKLHPADNARSFTGALLQDMAVPLLAHARPDDYGAVLETWHASPGTELHVLERQAFQWSHDEVGANLSLEWDLPESITELIGAHHQDDDTRVPPALLLVSVHRETEREHAVEAMLEDARARYEVDPDWLIEAVRDCERRALEVARALA